MAQRRRAIQQRIETNQKSVAVFFSYHAIVILISLP
jgi:hypothetical protein